MMMKKTENIESVLLRLKSSRDMTIEARKTTSSEVTKEYLRGKQEMADIAIHYINESIRKDN